MRALAVLGLAACWTGSQPAPAPLATTPPPTAGSCLVEDREIVPPASPKLSHDGRVFAEITASPLERMFVTFDRERARARIETDQLELTADLVLEDLRIRARSMDPYNGWLVIEGADAKEAYGSKLAIEVELPTGVDPSRLRVQLPCDQLTFAVPPDRAEIPGDARWLELEPGTRTPLTATAADKTAAVVLAPSSAQGTDPVRVRVLETRGAMTRVELAGDHSLVRGWIARTHAHESDAAFESGYGFGYGTRGMQTTSCSHSVSIFVDGARVGRFKPNATIQIERYDNDQIQVYLGAGGNDDARPYVMQRDIEDC